MKDKIREITAGFMGYCSVRYSKDDEIAMSDKDVEMLDKIVADIYQATRLDEDSINKIETLIGFVRASGEGKFSFQDKMLVDVADEAQEWIDTFKKQDELTKE